MNHLKIHQLSLVYPNQFQALNGIELHLKNGIFGLLGPNGAGKSSLMNTIVGLQKPSGGQMHFNGTDIIANPKAIQQHLGFLPQDFGVYPKVSAYQLMDHLAILKGVYPAKMRQQQILEVLEKVNLFHVKDEEVFLFSGGMKQRFGVAQALLGAPKVLIVDEPTAGLDPEERNRFNALLSDLSQDRIIILSTHLVEDVRNICSQMAIISKGTILDKGTPKDSIKRLKGKLWKKAVSRYELDTISHVIVSEELIERVLYVTVYSELQPEGFVAVQPTLEHAYFYTLNQ